MTHKVMVIGPMPPLRGGISHHTAKLAASCEDAGLQVTRVSWKSQYPHALYRRIQRDPNDRLDASIEWMLTWWNPVSWVRVGRRAARVDVVVMPWVTPVHALAQIVVLLLARRSFRVVHVHNVLPHERIPLQRLLARRTLSLADLLTVHASSLSSELAEMGIRTETEVVPMPPLLDVAPSALPPSPPFRLLFLGMIRSYKGLDLAIAASNRVRQRGLDVELTIAGEVWDDSCVPSDAEVEQLVVPLRTSYGYASDADVVTLLRDHHALVAPYRSATQSAIVSLALAAGRPVVATNVGGLGEIVVEGTNGSLADPEDVEGIADAIERVLERVDLLSSQAGATAGRWTDYPSMLITRLTRRRV